MVHGPPRPSVAEIIISSTPPPPPPPPPPDHSWHCMCSPRHHPWHYKWSQFAVNGPPLYLATNVISSATILILFMMEDSSKLGHSHSLYDNQWLQTIWNPSHFLTSSHVHYETPPLFAIAPGLLIALRSG